MRRGHHAPMSRRPPQPDVPMPDLYLCGFGYTAAYVASNVDPTVWSCVALTRGPARMVAAGGYPLGMLHFDAHREPPVDADLQPHLLRSDATAIVSIPPSADNAEAQAGVYMRWLAGQGVRRAVYLSATSVYGRADGAVVHADSDARPDTPRGHARLKHERAWIAAGATHGVHTVALRLPGIYGPGRSGAERLLSGQWKLVDGGVMFTNRIHVHDIMTACLTLLEAPELPAGDWLAVDDHPFQVVEMARFMADRLCAPMPPSVGLDEVEPSVRDFWTGDRRCSNAKLRSLGWAPIYPSYREGLPACWRAEGRLV